MKNRAIISRINAKKPAKKTKKRKPVTIIYMVNPETKDVLKSFADIEDAVEQGYDKNNILRALKNNTVYKKALWL